jgi:hypothetical protein
MSGCRLIAQTEGSSILGSVTSSTAFRAAGNWWSSKELNPEAWRLTRFKSTNAGFPVNVRLGPLACRLPKQVLRMCFHSQTGI